MLGIHILRKFRRIPQAYRYQACDISGGCADLVLPESGWSLCTTCANVYTTLGAAQAAHPGVTIYSLVNPADSLTYYFVDPSTQLLLIYAYTSGNCRAESYGRVLPCATTTIRIWDITTGQYVERFEVATPTCTEHAP